MSESTSIGPAESAPSAGAGTTTGAPPVEVDAQNASERDMRNGLAGAETKPPVQSPTRQANRSDKQTAKANERASVDDKLSERLNPGSTGGGSQVGRAPPRGA